MRRVPPLFGVAVVWAGVVDAVAVGWEVVAAGVVFEVLQLKRKRLKITRIASPTNKYFLIFLLR
jgi:hypothetical protein